MKISSFVAGLFCLAFGPPTSAQPEPKPVERLTVEEKVGQLMIWGFNGTTLSPELKRTLTKYQPGALILFRRNILSPTQVAALNSELHKFAGTRMKAPLFTMIDQEGGLVTRIRTATPMPSALALAKMDDPDFVERYAKASAELLKLLGFNVNLAPVLDISNPQKDSFIGNRTFGDHPDEVARLSMAFSRGLAAGGLVPTAKHFPGHGGTKQDSHQTTPKKSATLEELMARDLVPFSDFSGADFPRAIMTAHLALPSVDPSGLPATYSKLIIEDQLRAGIGYAGLVITDDLEMSGASIAKDVGDRALRAFQAGNDMVMVAGSQANQRRAFDALLKAVKDGSISEERLNQSVTRVLEAKARLNTPAGKADLKRLSEAFTKINALSKQVLKRNFDIAGREARKGWAQTDADTHVTVFSASYYFFQKFQKAFRGKTKFFHMRPTTLDNVFSELESGRADLSVFFASGNTTADWLNHLPSEQKAKLIVVNCNPPGDIPGQDDFMSVLNVNSYFSDSGTWLAELLNESFDEIRTPAAEGEPPPGE